MDLRKFQRECTNRAGDTTVTKTWVKGMRISHFFSERAMVANPPRWLHRCGFVEAGEDFVKVKGKAITQTAGVALGFVQLNAQAGYNSEVSVTYDAKQDSRVCSNNKRHGPNQARGVRMWPESYFE
jgi:hypothetical protein